MTFIIFASIIYILIGILLANLVVLEYVKYSHKRQTTPKYKGALGTIIIVAHPLLWVLLYVASVVFLYNALRSAFITIYR